MREYFILHPDYFVAILICGVIVVKIVMMIVKGGYGDDDDKGDDGDEGEDGDPVLDLPPGIDLPIEEDEFVR
jgi:hypothetical protein